MNHRLVASVALTISALGLGAGMNGCSAAPQDADVGATREGITLPAPGAGTNATVSCTAPFTYAQPQNCVRNPHGMTCGPAKCVGTTEAPTTGQVGYYASISPASTPIAIPPPSALAAIGCTWGIQVTVVASIPAGLSSTANFWTCPASVQAEIPTYFGTAVPCTGVDPTATPVLCEFDFQGTRISSNPFVGDTTADWILVEEGTEGFFWNGWIHDAGDNIFDPTSCPGGCLGVLAE